MNPQFATKVLQYVEVNSALLKRALDELQGHRALQKKAGDLRPDLLKRMIEVGCVNDGSKEAAEAMLAGHAETLGLLKSAVDKIADLKERLHKSAGELGRGEETGKAGTASEKTAGDYDSLSDGYVGRRTSQLKASDQAILKVLNT